jgi:hypothetical protein
MSQDDFARSLVRSARLLDVPKDGAKARALEHLATTAAAAAAGAIAGVPAAHAGASAATTATLSAKLGAATWSLVAAAAVAGAVGGYGVGRAVSVPANEPRVVAPSPRLDPPPSLSSVVAQPASAVAPATCSRKGKPVPFSLENECGADVEVFWVDDKCEEVFHKRLAPGESWRQVSQDGHVWRVRDRATHALLKEFAPKRLPGAPELVREATRRVLPEVVVRPNEQAKDEVPAACSGYGMPTKLTVRNERDEQVVLMWIGHDCEEKYHERIGPKQSLVVNGVDADAWRVRDARTGEVVTDIAPEVPDTLTYVTVP